MKAFGKFSFLILILPVLIYSQDREVFDKLQNGDFLGYINSLEETIDIHKNIQALATAYSIVGDNKKSLEVYMSDNHASEFTSKLVQRYNSDDVTYELLDKISLKKMIEDVDMLLINEAHHMPLHRKYLIEQITELFDLGYRYLFVEALTNFRNPKINQRGMPHLDDIGFYKDPLFGNFLREALNCGFLVFAYEPRDPNLTFEERELGMAKNIMEILATLPSAKAIVHGGYTHIATKNNLNNTKLMGMFLKEKFNVMSIDQTVHCENISQDYETNFYISKSKTINELTFFKNIGKESYYDISLLHPRTKYINNKPNWLIYDKKQDFINIDCPVLSNKDWVLIQVFKKDEYEQLRNKAFPLYQFIEEITSDCKLPYYYKYEEDETLIVRDDEGLILFQSNISDL